MANQKAERFSANAPHFTFDIFDTCDVTAYLARE